MFKSIACNAPSVDIAGRFPEKEFEDMARSGLLKIVLPGERLDFNVPHLKGLLHLLKQTGSANLSVGRIYEGHINALQLVDAYARKEQKEKWFQDAVENKLFGVWNSEGHDGVTIEAVGNNKYRLTGSKMFCSGAHWIQRPVVTGRLKDGDKSGWQMCVLSMEKLNHLKIDSSFWNPMGMKASASFKIDFTGVEICACDLLGMPDSYYKEPFFNGGAIRFAAVQLGGAMAIIDATHKFLKTLKRTGTDYQKGRMAEMAILAECGNNWLNSAAAKMGGWHADPASAEKNTAYSGMVRTAIENICSRIIYLSGVCTGPMGLMHPGLLERLHRDLTFYLRQPAPDAVVTGVGNYLFNLENMEDAFT